MFDSEKIKLLQESLEAVTSGMDYAGVDSMGNPICPWCRYDAPTNMEEPPKHYDGCVLVQSRKVLEETAD